MLTSNVTPARAKALKSPTVPSTAVKTNPSFWAVTVYSKSLWRGPTLQNTRKETFTSEEAFEYHTGVLSSHYGT